MNTGLMDVDPLSSYEHYNAYQPPFPPQPNIPHPQPIPQTQPNIPHTQPIPQTQPNIPHTQPIPQTQPNIPNIPLSNQYPYKDYYQPNVLYNQNVPCAGQNNVQNATEVPLATEGQNPNARMTDDINTNQNTSTDQITMPIEEEDIKPDISKIKLKRVKKLKGKTSNYWNKKVTDKDFKFYGCSVCNISFQDLKELDAHVTMHSNRVTSYDIRVQNLKKRKQLMKQKKKKKRESKVKNEFELEIKPEDGYVGTEKAAEYNAQMDIMKNEDEKKFEDVAKEELADVKNDVKTIENGEMDKKKGNQKDEVYKCFACNKKFALSYYLKIHVRSHTDEKPYVCNYCGQTFITASKLGRHNKRIHLAIRHQCRICFKFFFRFEILTRHFDKKHADQKLDGEPYDYNAILPYLTELEEQFKVQAETKKPKTEDPWGEWPLEAPLEAPGPTKVELEAPAVAKVEGAKIEKEEKESIPLKFEFATNSSSEQKMEPVEIKLEPEVLVEPGALPESEGFDETFERDPDSSDEDNVKEERLPPTDDEDEYFPPGGWARSPPPASPTAPSPPPVRRQKGVGVCELCNRSFSSRSYMKVHMRTHTGERPFSCYVCGRGFITASKMHRHVLTHDEMWVGENKIKPEGADIKSEVEDDDDDDEKKLKRSNSKIEKAKDKLLKKPNKKMDPTLKKGRVRPHCCEYCDKKFLHVETLQVHKRSHEGEELVLKCSFCLEPQLDQQAKVEHEETHKGPKPYLCTLCGRHYKDRGAMVYHRKNHKPSDDKFFICDICSKRFNSQTKLAKHILTHSSEKFVLRYECPVCANMFHTRWHVQMHLKSHQKEGLILEENRNAVLAMVLQNARKIPKSDAQSTLNLSQNLSLNLSQNLSQNLSLSAPSLPPGDERSRICNICGEVFQHFYYLEEHLKTHGSRIAVEDLDKEEEKKYTCQVCSKSFKLHYYLKLHSFTHTKEKPFICQQCGKGFITKGKLKRHLETHQGLKKFQCHICCKFFTRPSYMRIHVRTIHGTQDYNFTDYGVGVPVGLGVPLGQITDNSM